MNSSLPELSYLLSQFSKLLISLLYFLSSFLSNLAFCFLRYSFALRLCYVCLFSLVATHSGDHADDPSLPVDTGFRGSSKEDTMPEGRSASATFCGPKSWICLLQTINRDKAISWTLVGLAFCSRTVKTRSCTTVEV